MGKTVPLVLSTALGLRPRAVLKTSGTVSSHTDRPSPVNNIYIFTCEDIYVIYRARSVRITIALAT